MYPSLKFLNPSLSWIFFMSNLIFKWRDQIWDMVVRRGGTSTCFFSNFIWGREVCENPSPQDKFFLLSVEGAMPEHLQKGVVFSLSWQPPCQRLGPPQGSLGWSLGGHNWNFLSLKYYFTYLEYFNKFYPSYDTPKPSQDLRTFTSSILVVSQCHGRFLTFFSNTYKSI